MVLRERSFGKMIRLLLTACFVVVLAGCSLFPKAGSDEDVIDLVLFADDFSGDAVGALPGKWTVNQPGNAVIEVVDAPDIASGKAVRIVGSSTEAGQETQLRAFLPDDPVLDNVTTIGFEHYVQVVKQGEASFLYVTAEGDNLTWGVPIGKFRFRTDEGTIDLADIAQGVWYRIRIIANREKNQAFVYLNDELLNNGDPLTMRSKPSTWRNAELRVQHSSRTDENKLAEALYSGFKVWIVDDETVAELWREE